MAGSQRVVRLVVMNKNCRSTIIAAAALAVVSLALVEVHTASAADVDKTERTVSVSANGSVSAVPDIAHISAGVATEAESAKAAIARNSAVMAKVIDGLKEAGIDAKDIRTTSLNVEPRYKERSTIVSGYRVSNLVRLTVRDVKRLGEIVDQAIALGANQVSQIAFDVADPERLKDEARLVAMENARRRGELYAKAAGAQLGPVLRIAEGSSHPNVPVSGVETRYAAAPVEAGTRRLEVQVSVVYALR
jgi:uncharacterized protein YggE